MSSYSAAGCQSSAGRICWVSMRAVKDNRPRAAGSAYDDRPLEDWLTLRARTHADRPALIAGGAALSYGNHTASALASAWNLGVAPDDSWLCVLPLFHVGGLSILLRSAVYGTAAIVHERFEAEAAMSSLESGEATLVSVVATMLRRM